MTVEKFDYGKQDRAWPLGEETPHINKKVQSILESHSYANHSLIGTRAMVVIHKDQLIAEFYAPGFPKDMRLTGWSMTKSVTSAFAGILNKQGKLDVDAPAPIPEWQKDDRKKITMRDLLQMSSGLSFTEIYFAFFDATEMLFKSLSTGISFRIILTYSGLRNRK